MIMRKDKLKVMVLNKNKNVAVVIPKEPTLREEFAACELKKYIKKICGAELTVITDGEAFAGEVFAIGGPERNSVTKNYISEEEFDTVVPGPEGLFIKSYGEVIVLAGSSKNNTDFERGTLYAVYELLERFLGASFSAFTKQDIPGGEFIPECDEIRLEDIFYVKAKADVSLREAVVQYQYQDRPECYDYELDIPFLDWLAKNRYNYINSWNGVYTHYKKTGKLQECVKRGLMFSVGHHDSIDTLLPQRGNEFFPEHYYETHPEYYRLEEDGSRFVDLPDFWGQMTLCMRNDEMIDTMIENLRQFLRENPNITYYSIPPKDGTWPQCCCDKCKEYSKMENYLYFITRIANGIEKDFPNVMLVVIIYTDLWEPPTYLKKLAKNICFVEAVWHSTGLRKTGKPDGSCLNGTFFEENLLKWKALGAKVFYYEYYMGVYPGRQRWVPMADEMQAIYKNIAKKGIEGTETQIEVYNHWNNIFNFYTFARTAYDTSKSMEDNLLLFSRIFGEGAPFVADIIRHGEETLDGQCEIMTSGVYLMKHIDKEWVYETYEKALAAATTKAARNNIRLMRMVFRYSDIETREEYKNDEKGYRILKHYDIPERGELLYMHRNFDTFTSLGGYGIMIPVEGEDNGFTPDKWYIFE